MKQTNQHSFSFPQYSNEKMQVSCNFKRSFLKKLQKLNIIFTLVFITLFIGKISGQELTNYQLYLQNGYLYNPAFTIENQNYSAYFNSHLQWLGFDGAPRISSFGINGPYNEKVGLGVNIVTKKHGTMASQQALINYAYKAQFKKDNYLLVGISAGIKNDKNDASQIYGNVDINDPTIASNQYNKVNIATAIGLSYFYKNFEAQLAIPNLLARDAAKLYSMGIFAYNHKINKDEWNLKPSIMVSGTSITPFLVEGNFTTEWNKTLWFQLGYRSTNALTLGIGVNFKDYQLGYSYRDDFGVMGMASSGSHEIQLIAQFRKRTKKKPLDIHDEILLATYTGRVTNSVDRKPVRANVVFYNEYGSIINEIKTNDQGKYSIELENNMTYKIEVQAENFARYETIVPSTKKSLKIVNISLEPYTPTLLGSCNVSNAQIAIYDTNNILIKTINTNSDGTYSTPIETNKNYTLEVKATGYQTLSLNINIPKSTVEKVVDLHLNAIILVKGNIKNNLTKEDITATMIVQDTTGKEVYNIEVNGSFEITLVESEYDITILGNNIITLKEHILISKENKEDHNLDIVVTPLSKGKTFSLGIVSFEQGKEIMLKESYPVLDNLVKIMNDNPTIRIEIGGHTDNSGEAEKNLTLSKQRAENVKEYVIKKGIKASRLKAVGYGQTKPLVPNTTAENRAKNRRVEFRIIKQFKSVQDDLE